jgi:hypothetical protein
MTSRKCRATSAVNLMAEVIGKSALLRCDVCMAQILREVVVAALVSRSLSMSKEKSAVPSASPSNSYPEVRNHHGGFWSIHAHVCAVCTTVMVSRPTSHSSHVCSISLL